MLKLHVLASGSKGNAAVVENAETSTGILIDCGICKRDFLARCTEAGFNPAHIKAVLITHEHSDHTKGLGVVLRGLAKCNCTPMIYINSISLENSSTLQKIAADFTVQELKPTTLKATELQFKNTKPEDTYLKAAGLSIYPFKTSHDSAASFGFRIEHPDGDSLGFLTDSGIVTPESHTALKNVRILALEANHDERMLKNGPYPYVIKQRIASEFGHLSNAQATEELTALINENRIENTREPETVVAMHVSQNNNEYRLARQALEEAISTTKGRSRVVCGFQERLTSVE